MSIENLLLLNIVKVNMYYKTKDGSCCISMHVKYVCTF